MSVTTPNQTNNFLQNDFDLSKIFIGNNRSKKATLLNNTGSEATLEPGTLLAFKSDVGQLVPLLSTNNTLGQDRVVGILRTRVVALANAATVDDVVYAISGDIAEGKIIFQGGDDLGTIVTDLHTIQADMNRVGLINVPTIEHTNFDNQ